MITECTSRSQRQTGLFRKRTCFIQAHSSLCSALTLYRPSGFGWDIALCAFVEGMNEILLPCINMERDDVTIHNLHYRERLQFKSCQLDRSLTSYLVQLPHFQITYCRMIELLADNKLDRSW
jgi:hypothetical protein